MDLDRWRGRSALVTGASSGIGAAIASALAIRVGMRVAVMARREDRLNALAAESRAQGAEMLVCHGDVSSDDDVAQCFEKIRSQWSGIDLLINNAGAATMNPLTHGEPQDWRKTLDVNVAAPAYCIQQALRDMALRDEGQIINISSIYAHRDQVPNFALYQASKSALRSLTNTLRAELAIAGTTIRVGMISPGMVATEFRAQATGGKFAYESYFEQYEPILPEDVVGAVLYMLSTRPHIQVQDILLSPLGQAL